MSTALDYINYLQCCDCTIEEDTIETNNFLHIKIILCVHLFGYWSIR